ncbi:acetate/propionate family kinase [Nocardioides salsibiostraticola]
MSSPASGAGSAGTRVLVLNAGSSSLKYSLLDGETGTEEASGLVERIGEHEGALTHETPAGKHHQERVVATFADAFEAALAAFAEHGPGLDPESLAAVGHRVVHGGSHVSAATLVDDDLIATVEELASLAPLHNPANAEGLRVARDLFPGVPQVAVFDTAFHQTMPAVAHTYAVPRQWREEYAVRRYGFHGTSYAFVSGVAADLLGRPLTQTNLIVLHLGNGASAAAVRGGVSVDTSMGMAPLEGLVMGTRSGDLDPAVHGHLHRHHGWSLADIDDALVHDSGLQGLTGDNDFRELLSRRAAGEADAVLAFDVYAYRIRKYVGAYYAVLGEVHGIVFTGGVGEHSPDLRAAAVGGLERLGIEVDETLNRVSSDQARVVSPVGCDVPVLVVPTNEEFEIARQALSVVQSE